MPADLRIASFEEIRATTTGFCLDFEIHPDGFYCADGVCAPTAPVGKIQREQGPARGWIGAAQFTDWAATRIADRIAEIDTSSVVDSYLPRGQLF